MGKSEGQEKTVFVSLHTKTAVISSFNSYSGKTSKSRFVVAGSDSVVSPKMVYVALVTRRICAAIFIISRIKQARPHPAHVIMSGRRLSLMKNLKILLIWLFFYLDHDSCWIMKHKWAWLNFLPLDNYSVTWWIIVCLPDIKWPSRIKTHSGSPQNSNACGGKNKLNIVLKLVHQYFLNCSKPHKLCPLNHIKESMPFNDFYCLLNQGCKYESSDTKCIRVIL